jgi:DNA-directed RNA polymerase specialized sigma24 family protein
MQNGPSGRTSLTPGMGKGLRLLLRFRVPEPEVDAIFHRIIDSLAVHSPRSSQELVALITQTANEICSRPPRPPQQSAFPGLVRKIREGVERSTEVEREVLTRRYIHEETIETIAISLHLTDDQVRNVLNRMKQRIVALR